MSGPSKIEWTQRTWNPIVGCTVHSPGCKNCFAMRDAWRLMHNPAPAIAEKFAGTARVVKGKPVWTGRINLHEPALLEPLRRKVPTVYFVNSMSDLFHQDVPDETIDQVFAVMALCPQHTFQLLTKRADRMRVYLTAELNSLFETRLSRIQFQAYRIAATSGARWNEQAGRAARQACVDALKRVDDRTNAGFANVWLGVSVEDQPRANERRADFLAAPGAVKFVSYEPALGPVDWTGWDFVDQIIAGGENGPDARPSHPDWYRATRDFCAPRNIAFFFKQWGGWAPPRPGHRYDTSKGRAGKPPAFLVKRDGSVHCFLDDGPRDEAVMVRYGKKVSGRLLDGVEHNGMPA